MKTYNMDIHSEAVAVGITESGVNYNELALKQHRKTFLMSNNWFVILITIAYILFVTLIGPRYMKNRRPFNVKYVMFVYNLFQVFANLYIVHEAFANNGFHFLKRMSLYGIKKEDNPYLSQLLPVCNLLLALKMIDLLDTVFMVLRKRFSQITFLHVYHHVLVVIFTYWIMKIEIGENLIFAGVINMTVHSVMYSYYCLSLSETLAKNYLYKYKIYITRMQLIQFVFIFMLLVYFVLNDGYPHSPILTWFSISQVILFFILFGNFYIKTYHKKETKQA